jgi:hypothetical protein
MCLSSSLSTQACPLLLAPVVELQVVGRGRKATGKKAHSFALCCEFLSFFPLLRPRHGQTKPELQMRWRWDLGDLTNPASQPAGVAAQTATLQQRGYAPSFPVSHQAFSFLAATPAAYTTQPTTMIAAGKSKQKQHGVNAMDAT